MDQFQLQDIEKSATDYFVFKSKESQQEAMSKLELFSINPDIINASQNIISKSNNPYAILFCSKTLQKYLTEHWGLISENKRNELSLVMKVTKSRIKK